MSLSYSLSGDARTQSNSRNGSATNKCRLSSKNFSGKGKLQKRQILKAKMILTINHY